MTTFAKYPLEEGDLYVFSDTQTDISDRLWGLFREYDAQGRIVLEAVTEDFYRFNLNVVLPAQYDKVEPASRAELRDFAYNMGLMRV